MENNFRHGFGVLAQRILNTDTFKLCYRGDWKNGRMHGHGLRIYPDKSFYIGGFHNGKRDRHGQQWYDDGAFFDGHFKDDLKDGLGVLIRADGNRYEGEWKAGLKHGKGLFFHLDNGQLQEGVWHNDMCVSSQMEDLEYRQCAIDPTPYAIPKITLKSAEQVYKLAKDRALAGNLDQCQTESNTQLETKSQELYSVTYSDK